MKKSKINAGCYQIDIENVTLNAFSYSPKRFISYRKLSDYSEAVGEVLRRNNKNFAFKFSRETAQEMLVKHSRLFREIRNDGKPGLLLNPGITANDIIASEQGYISLDVLYAFADKQALAVLGVVDETKIEL